VAAFTLVELMIAIALMLLLMVGINVIFKITGEAVGTGQALSESLRNAQGAQAVMYRDFSNIAGDDAPFLIIHSRTQPAFRNKQDMLADTDFNPAAPDPTKILTTDLDGKDTDNDGNVEGDVSVVGERVQAAMYNSRNHRTDIIQFFAHDLFRRQTGNLGTYVADQSSLEATIWYGHLWLPDGSGSFNANTLPGAGSPTSNPNNYFASQWILGRQAILLNKKDASGNIVDGALNNQDFIDVTGALPLSPLQYASTATQKTTGTLPYQIQDSRYDLAATSMADFRTVLDTYIANNTSPSWWSLMMAANTQRFRASSVVFKPIDSVQSAKMTPIFLPGCTQFIVEYAGDFVRQDNNTALSTYGNVIDGYFDPTTGPNFTVKPGGTDGVIDYIVMDPVTKRTQIRWYGLPRDTNGDGSIAGPPFASGGGGANLKDVVPLRDVLKASTGTGSASYTGNVSAPFERLALVPGPGSTLTPRPSYLNPTGPTAQNMQPGEYYTCAWGPRDKVKPSMIRITIVLDDPSGRLGEGKTYEYVFKIQ
jgi:type II secretory pathway pseudopilin PulG